ncbi:uncharacterized protein EDB91DRAFT_1146407 [Suillus paluster]|uniref:uncharacterized protein n=1 Tax=Suillus paluster TaxID=48578 RepID=UPI001B86999D|nr:uncharacterized protein EDB91DRAFT_1146407 [Suillus paluster]KAG1734706.1 hypothetical protein EDB91DRAFT_1146407 [Suillus paluster]
MAWLRALPGSGTIPEAMCLLHCHMVRTFQFPTQIYSQFLIRRTTVADCKPLQGRGIRIGSTLKHLFRNVPFDAVQIKGR